MDCPSKAGKLRSENGLHAVTHVHTLAGQLFQCIRDRSHFDATKICNQSAVGLRCSCSAGLRAYKLGSIEDGARSAAGQKNRCDRVGFRKAAKLVHFVLQDVYMCADSTMVFRRAEESIHCLRKGTEMKMSVRTTTALFMSAIAIALTPSAAVQPAFAQERKSVNLSPARGLPFSDGIVAGNTLYVAGQEGTDASDKLVAGGIGPETTAALENIQKVLKAAGFELKDVVSVTVYLADIHEFPEMNKIYKGVMPDPKPARATIQAAALVNGARIEISAIAVKQK